LGELNDYLVRWNGTASAPFDAIKLYGKSYMMMYDKERIIPAKHH
jgi:hypothetical protein